MPQSFQLVYTVGKEGCDESTLQDFYIDFPLNNSQQQVSLLSLCIKKLIFLSPQH